MTIDPEGIYLELLPGSTTINVKTGKTTKREAIRLNWKPDPRPGTKWAYRTFVGDSLGTILRELGDYLDANSLEALLGEVAA
jgi:hypothetical protein